MGTQDSSTVNAGDNVLASQYNDLRADAINPQAFNEPSGLSDFLISTNSKDLLEGTGSFETWPSGDGQPPEAWKRSIKTLGVSREGSTSADSSGSSVKVFGAAGGYVFHRVYKNIKNLRGKYITGVYTGNQSGTISIGDNVGVTASSAVASSATFNENSVSHLVNSAATYIEFRFNSVNASTRYAEGALFEGRYAWKHSNPDEMVNKLAITGILDVYTYKPEVDDSDSLWMSGWGTSWQDLGPFPDVVSIIATGTTVSIYNAETSDLWMQFDGATNKVLDGTANDATQVHMRNGVLFVCWDDATPDGATGLIAVDFRKDEIIRILTTGYERYKGTIRERNDANGYSNVISKSLKMASTRPLCVHTQIVSEMMYVACGSQANGLSLMAWDGTAVKRHANIQQNASAAVYQVHITEAGHLVYIDTNTARLYVLDNAVTNSLPANAAGIDQTVADAFTREYEAPVFQADAYESPTLPGVTAINSTVFGGARKLDVAEGSQESTNRIYIAGDDGVTILHDDVAGTTASWATLINTKFYSVIGARGFCWPLDDSGNPPVDGGPNGRDLTWAGTPIAGTLAWDAAVDFDGSTDYAFETPEQEFVVSSGTDLNIGDLTANTRRAQAFKSSITCNTQGVYLRVKKVGTPTDNIEVVIETDSSGVPSGTEVTPKYAFAGGSLSTSYQWVHFPFNQDTSDIVATTQYHITIQRSTGIDASNYYVVEADSSGGYADGFTSLRDGSSWTTNSPSGHDIGFEFYPGNTSTPKDKLTTYDQLTAGAWIRADTFSGNSAIVGKWTSDGTSSHNRKQWLLYVNSSSQATLEVSGDGFTTDKATSSITLETGELYFISGRYDGPNKTMQIYINGEDDIDATISSDVVSSLHNETAKLTIGGNWSDKGDHAIQNLFDGEIANVFVSYDVGQNTGTLIRDLWTAGSKVAGYRFIAGDVTDSVAVEHVLTSADVRSVSVSNNLLAIGTNSEFVVVDTDSYQTVFSTVSHDMLGTVNTDVLTDVEAVSIKDGTFTHASSAAGWIHDRKGIVPPPTVQRIVDVSVTHLSGPLRSRPQPGLPGRTYTCTDLAIVLTDNGSEWLIPTSGTHLSMCEYEEMSGDSPASDGTDSPGWMGAITTSGTIEDSGGSDNTIWKLKTGTTNGAVARVLASDFNNHNFDTARKFILMVRVRGTSASANQRLWGGLALEANLPLPANLIGIKKTDTGNWFAHVRVTGVTTQNHDLGAANFAMAIFEFDGTDLKIYKDTFNAAGLLGTEKDSADIPQIQMAGGFRIETDASTNNVEMHPDTFLLHMESN